MRANGARGGKESRSTFFVAGCAGGGAMWKGVRAVKQILDTGCQSEIVFDGDESAETGTAPCGSVTLFRYQTRKEYVR